jgi:transposase
VARLTAQAPALAEAVALAQDFASLVRQRQPEALDVWLARAATSTLIPFRRFAKGLQADYAAVQAAVTLPWSQGPIEGHINLFPLGLLPSGRKPWSQGPIEGHINRLKMLKRQMFGRAGLDLLARRFLLTACPSAGYPRRRACAAPRMVSLTCLTKIGQEP